MKIGRRSSRGELGGELQELQKLSQIPEKWRLKLDSEKLEWCGFCVFFGTVPKTAGMDITSNSWALSMEEILRRLISGLFIQLFTWLHTCQLVQDFFHQQYEWSFHGIRDIYTRLLDASFGEQQLWTEGGVTDLRVFKIPSHNSQPHRFQSAHLSGWRICTCFR